MKQACVYLEILIQFIQAALRSYFLFRTLWSRHVTVKHAGSYDETSVSGFPSREMHTSSTPQLKTQIQQSNTMRYAEFDKIHGSFQEMCNSAETHSYIKTIKCLYVLIVIIHQKTGGNTFIEASFSSSGLRKTGTGRFFILLSA